MGRPLPGFMSRGALRDDPSLLFLYQTIVGSPRVAKSLRDSAQRRREDGFDLVTFRAVALGETALLLQQRHLQQRQRVDIWIAQPDRRLEHRRVAQQMLGVADLEHRVDGALELVL